MAAAARAIDPQVLAELTSGPPSKFVRVPNVILKEDLDEEEEVHDVLQDLKDGLSATNVCVCDV